MRDNDGLFFRLYVASATGHRSRQIQAVVDGLGAMWQRGRTTLLRWLHLVQIARTLLILLTARAEPQTLALIRLGSWRPAATLTPGLVKEALAARFRNFEAFRLLLETYRKSGPVRSTGPPAIAVAA